MELICEIDGKRKPILEWSSNVFSMTPRKVDSEAFAEAQKIFCAGRVFAEIEIPLLNMTSKEWKP
ncbi:hypothetical protein HI914_03981 [Erysiphe necator]|nr:hypothetical protein HI914_03981 [Erysiphe necator]